jgi:hypothetical protein
VFSRRRSLKTKKQTGIFCHPKEFIKLAGNNEKRNGVNLKFVDGFINEKPIKIMIDTGSEITLVNRKLIEEVNLTSLIYKIPRVNLVGANKRTLATINEGIRVMVRLKKNMYALQCVIMPNMSHDMIVGVDELTEKHVVIDFKTNTMKITKEKEEEQDKEQEKQITDESEKEQTVEMNLATKKGKGRKRGKGLKKIKEKKTWDSSKDETSSGEEDGKILTRNESKTWDSSKEETSPTKKKQRKMKRTQWRQWCLKKTRSTR